MEVIASGERCPNETSSVCRGKRCVLIGSDNTRLGRENLQRMKVFDETAKSFGAKQETQLDKLKEQALKDKHAFIEKERKAESARIEAAAKERSAADSGESRNELLTKERQQRIADDKKIQEKNLKEMSKFTPSTMPK